MNRLPIVAGVILLIIALVFVNRGIRTNAPPEHDEDAQKQTQQQKPPAPVAAKPVISPSSIPPEITAGDPAAAPYKITVGWSYDPAAQSNPQALQKTLQEVQQFAAQHKDAAVEIVNLDVPADQRSPQAQSVTQAGVAVNGKVVVPGNPGQGAATANNITAALQSAIPQK